MLLDISGLLVQEKNLTNFSGRFEQFSSQRKNMCEVVPADGAGCVVPTFLLVPLHHHYKVTRIHFRHPSNCSIHIQVENSNVLVNTFLSK
jgi:hypothetical protein